MLADKPVILLVKLPMPEPFVVLLFAVVGLPEVFQHTPLAVTEAPPLLAMFPPLDAEISVILVIATVERVGIVVVVVADVVNV